MACISASVGLSGTGDGSLRPRQKGFLGSHGEEIKTNLDLSSIKVVYVVWSELSCENYILDSSVSRLMCYRLFTGKLFSSFGFFYLSEN